MTQPTLAWRWSEDAANGTRMGRWLTTMEWTFMQEALSTIGHPRRILDVGGGDGRFTRRLEPSGITSVILERDMVPLTNFRSRHGSAAPVVLGDGNRLPVRPATFDCILAMQVSACTESVYLQHFLAQCHTALVSRGWVIFTTHNAASLIGMRKRLNKGSYKWDAYEAYTESYFATRSTITQAGFTPVIANGYRWVPFSRDANHSLVPLSGLLEQALGLRHLPQVSPWVFWAVQKLA